MDEKRGANEAVSEPTSAENRQQIFRKAAANPPQIARDAAEKTTSGPGTAECQNHGNFTFWKHRIIAFFATVARARPSAKIIGNFTFWKDKIKVFFA